MDMNLYGFIAWPPRSPDFNSLNLFYIVKTCEDLFTQCEENEVKSNMEFYNMHSTGLRLKGMS